MFPAPAAAPAPAESAPPCPAPALVLVFFTLCLGADAFGATPIRSAQAKEDSVIPGFAVGEISYIWNGDSGFETLPGAEFENEEALVSVPVPLHTDENNIFATGIHYRRNHMEFSGVPFLPRDLDLHQLYIPFSLVHSFNDRWSLWLYLAPGVTTDFIDLDSDAFDLAARFTAIYKVDDRLTLIGGLTNSREYGEETVTPIFGSIWHLSPRLQARLTFPRPSINFAPREGTLLSLRITPGGGSWTFYDDRTGRNRNLDYSSIRAGLSAEQQLGKFSWAFIESGMRFAQEFEVEGRAPEYDADPTWYFSSGIRLRF